jgi:hypothetical protein
MHRSSEFHPQPGLRRVLDAVKIAAAEMKATPDLVSSPADRLANNVVYLADVRRRVDHNDEPSGPPPGAAAARSYELIFSRAVATDWHFAA